jgi:predicted nucleotidyltransferase
METGIQVIAKYLVEKSQAWFTKKKQVMSIWADRIVLQGLNSNLQSEVNLKNVEWIYYHEIKAIMVEERNMTDFVIVASKKYEFSWHMRNRLIWELKHESLAFVEDCDWDTFYCKLMYDMYNPCKF